MRRLYGYVKQLWSVTHFQDDKLSGYAQDILIEETRSGVSSLGLLLLVLIVSAVPVYMLLELHPIYLYTYVLLSVLSIHISLSARRVYDIQVLYLLGIVLLTISATAFVSIAHQTHSFSVLLFANVVLLFIAIPMVPWGVREAAIVVTIIYGLLSISTSYMPEKFGIDNLLVLQFLMIASSLISITLVARSVGVKKADLAVRYELEKARENLYQLSNIDPLTGAGNRRFEPEAFTKLIEQYGDKVSHFHYALFDINNFKILNDTFGHDFGDKVLECIGRVFLEKIEGNGYLIRLGGDEFSLLLVHEQPELLIKEICKEIEEQCAHVNPNADVSLSYGLISAPHIQGTTLKALYLSADSAMYHRKQDAKTCRLDFLTESSAVVSEL